MIQIDKTLLSPTVARTIRFSPVLFEWLREFSETEGISFNHAVLICCKNAMEQYSEEKKTLEKEPQNE